MVYILVFLYIIIGVIFINNSGFMKVLPYVDDGDSFSTKVIIKFYNILSYIFLIVMWPLLTIVYFSFLRNYR